MKKTLALLISIWTIAFSTIGLCETESSFFALADTYVQKYIDCSDKQVWELKSDYDNSEVYQINFDFTSGFQAIELEEKGQCKLYFFIEDAELMSTLMRMVTVFKEIESQLPKGKSLEYRMKFSEDEIYYITNSTLNNYYQWLKL